jgi:hypothetical protein
MTWPGWAPTASGSIYNGSGSTVHLVADVAGWYGAE